MGEKRCTLHKNKLGEFKKWLDSQGIPYRKGKGPYQVIQVLTAADGWQVVYEKIKMPEHFSVNEKLMPIVREFTSNNNNCKTCTTLQTKITELQAEVERLKEFKDEVKNSCRIAMVQGICQSTVTTIYREVQKLELEYLPHVTKEQK